jgi:cytochrome c peroxidase
MKAFTLYSFLAIGIFFLSCKPSEEKIITSAYTSEEFSAISNDLDLPETPDSYSFGNKESGIQSDLIGTLGRVLFYDKNLSSDNRIACASCHQQTLGFADNKAFSHGPNGNTTNRNSIALSSFRSFGRHYDKSIDDRSVPGLFWDERAESISEQLRATINNPDEMGMELQQIVELMEGNEVYRILHKKAFPNERITEDHILQALEVFINSIGSKNTKFETQIFSELNFITGDSVSGNLENNLGLQLFKTHCNSCHGVNFNLLNNTQESDPIIVANNGLIHSQDDLGVYIHTQNPQDIGKFKVPGLLNIELTAPYMHDGRFETLEEVVEFYNSGIEYSPTLHPNLRDGNNAKRLNLSEEEKSALIEFLKSLTDTKVLTTEKWSDPFLHQ